MSGKKKESKHVKDPLKRVWLVYTNVKTYPAARTHGITILLTIQGGLVKTLEARFERQPEREDEVQSRK